MNSILQLWNYNLLHVKVQRRKAFWMPSKTRPKKDWSEKPYIQERSSAQPEKDYATGSCLCCKDGKLWDFIKQHSAKFKKGFSSFAASNFRKECGIKWDKTRMGKHLNYGENFWIIFLTSKTVWKIFSWNFWFENNKIFV